MSSFKTILLAQTHPDFCMDNISPYLLMLSKGKVMTYLISF